MCRAQELNRARRYPLRMPAERSSGTRSGAGAGEVSPDRSSADRAETRPAPAPAPGQSTSPVASPRRSSKRLRSDGPSPSSADAAETEAAGTWSATRPTYACCISGCPGKIAPFMSAVPHHFRLPTALPLSPLLPSWKETAMFRIFQNMHFAKRIWGPLRGNLPRLADGRSY